MHWKKFLEPTCWAVWAVVVGGASLWVVIGSIGYFSKFGWLPSDTSGWAQAIGSVAAIGAAFHIGNIQYKRQLAQYEKDAALKKAETRTLMSRLSQNTVFQFDFLHNALSLSMADFGKPSLVNYLMAGNDIRWVHLMEALQAMDVRDLDGMQTMLLMDLKVGCSFAIRVCDHINNWTGFGDHERLLTFQVEYHKSQANAAYQAFTQLTG